MSDVQIPHRIIPDAIYHDGDARQLLGLTSPTMARARRERRLRYTRQGHAILYRGRWLLDWLEADATFLAKGVGTSCK